MYRNPRLKVLRKYNENIQSLSAKDFFSGKKNEKKKFKLPEFVMTKDVYRDGLNAKQYIKAIFVLSDQQLKNYIVKSRVRISTLIETFSQVTVLYNLLKLRLDNIVFNAGLAKTIPEARQRIKHGCVTVNNKVIRSYNYSCKNMDIIECSGIFHYVSSFKVYPYFKQIDNQTVQIIKLPCEMNSEVMSKLQNTLLRAMEFIHY